MQVGWLIKMNETERLNYFFSTLQAKRQAFVENYAYFAPKLAPSFNCFNFIRPDELKLSEILAMLLNPDADHTQKELFLKLFFDTIEIEYPITKNIKVNCEATTHLIKNKDRRIDIVVNFDNKFGLAIENKPWAGDQYQQLVDYAEQMQAQFGNDWCLVYLSGNDSDPDKSSVTKEKIEIWEKENHYRKINFSHIVDWLKACEAQCQADPVRHFLRDFINYCKTEFLGKTSMIDANLIKDFSLENTKNLEIALAVGQQIAVIKEQLLERFSKDLECKFKVEYPNWKVEISEDFTNFITDKRYKKIKFHKLDWKNYFLVVQFEGTKYVEFFYGIYKEHKETADLPIKHIELLKDNLSTVGASSPPHYPWYSDFPAPYNNWNINIEPWLTIQSGEMVKMVANQIIELAKEAETMIDEAEKKLQSKAIL